jgi:hypothetical protein
MSSVSAPPMGMLVVRNRTRKGRWSICAGIGRNSDYVVGSRR